MVFLKRIVLDVLKPHHPNPLEFARAIAEQSAEKGGYYRVKLTVQEMDEKTETVVIIIEGEDINFAAITEIVSRMGGSLHSIDEVEVTGAGPTPSEARTRASAIRTKVRYRACAICGSRQSNPCENRTPQLQYNCRAAASANSMAPLHLSISWRT